MSEQDQKTTQILRCVIPECSWTYTCSFDSVESLAVLKMHMDYAHPTPNVQYSTSKAPKFEAPSIDAGVDQETWVAFTLRWQQYCQGSGISPELQSLRLFQCASQALGNLLLMSKPHITSCTPDVVLEELRQLAVIPTSKGVARAALMKMTQDNNEPFRTFAARVQGKAQVCGFVAKQSCRCGEELTMNYTSEVIKDVIVAGIADEGIRTSVLETEDLEGKALNEIISMVERKEKAKAAYRTSTVSALSSFKRQAKSPTQKVPTASSKTPCPQCKKPFQRFNGKNIKPFEICLNCFRSSRQRNRGKVRTVAGIEMEQAALLQDAEGTNEGRTTMSVNGISGLKTRDHPRVAVRLQPVGCENVIAIRGIADTGSQPNIWGRKDFLKAGLSVSMLEDVNLTIKAANQEPLHIIGAFRAEFEGDAPDNTTISCQAMVFVSSSISGMYIGLDTLIDLEIISRDFPYVGSCSVNSLSLYPTPTEISESSSRLVNSGCPKIDNSSSRCNCPLRSAVPERPKTLPFKPVPENNVAMKKWLLEFFGSSTFNTCPHRPLQEMEGPPIEIHVADDAVPRVCHTPAQIPLHWQQQVYEDIKRDEAMGILEKVPYGEPVTWCHRLVVTRKHNGSPRRTVDLSPLNKYCSRETHGAESPYHLARRIPRGTWKTVSDAWNGYHSVPLRPSDRHLTTFITPFGRWRYTRAPQGYLSSGDGYNRRFQAIIEDFPRKERCVDDTIHYDDDLETHYWRTIDFLMKVGQSGIVLNPDKFQFASKEVDFAGFRICNDTVEPLPQYLKAIQHFPRPQSSTDIRSWFGLVNQVSTYAQLRDTMAPFRKFLSPRTTFAWNPSLEKAFEKSKSVIIDAIREGVQIFDIDKPTCLRPDWSKKGIGYILLQKHCECSDPLPSCCEDGWRITVAGSRFLTETESRYAAVEGEALAIAWGLEQTRYFTQGCDKLLVVTDHKPLVKVFGDQTLDAITNTRLFRLKQRTLQWKFTVAYLPGSTNSAADAASRNPCPSVSLLSSSDFSTGDLAEQLIVASICHETTEIISLDWDTIVAQTASDPVLSELARAISNDYRGDYPNISPFHRYRESLYLQDGVVMYCDRVVVPTVLRSAVLDTLHSAHQGVASMQLRAQTIVFWPGITRDIIRIRERCEDCNRNSPSQAALPSEPASCPSTPFQHVFSDFFEFSGRKYLVIGDRLSGFSEVFFTPAGTSSSGASGLIVCLRKLFQTFGVPEELSSDGGPEFLADATQQFLRTWNVRHRVSSAYHPKSNGRAEVAVKVVKRLMRTNVNASGRLHTDRFLRAMLQLRNTPDPDCGVSPAEIVFGRRLRDNLQFTSYVQRSVYSPRWQEAWSAKEEALKARFVKTSEKLNMHARYLPPLAPGDRCFIQNQVGNSKRRWHQTGTVVEAQPCDRYGVRVDGSGRVTYRNRQFLRKFTPYSTRIRGVNESLTSFERGCRAAEHALTPSPTSMATTPESSPRGETGASTNGKTLPAEVEISPRHPVHPRQPDVPDESLSQGAGLDGDRHDTTPARLPLCLRRLQPHNKAGLRESPVNEERRH